MRGDKTAVHDLAKGAARYREQEFPQRQDTGQTALRIDDVEVEDHLDLAVLPNLGDRVADLRVLRQGEELRVHDPPGRVFLVGELGLEFVPVGPVEQSQDGLAQLVLEPVDDLDAVVDRQRREQPCDLRRRELLEQRPPLTGLQFQ